MNTAASKFFSFVAEEALIKFCVSGDVLMHFPSGMAVLFSQPNSFSRACKENAGSLVSVPNSSLPVASQIQVKYQLNAESKKTTQDHMLFTLG